MPNAALLLHDLNCLSELTLLLLQQIENCGVVNFTQATKEKGNGWNRLFYVLFGEESPMEFCMEKSMFQTMAHLV